MTARPARVFDAQELDAAAAWLLDGGLLVMPTESWYAIAADPRSPAAVDAVFRAKDRPGARSLPLLAGDLPQVELAAPGWRDAAAARRLAEAFWPGPLSLVVPGSREIAPGACDAAGRVAIRWSGDPLAAGVARLFGFPLTATSANRSGCAPADRPDAAVASLASAGRIAVLDGGRTPGGAPSTIVDVSGPEPAVLREGAIAAHAIGRCLAGERT